MQGSTLGAKNEFLGLPRCGLGLSLEGPQLYYSVELEAGSWYRFGLAPEFAATLLIAASAGGCKPENLEADCSGLTGSVLPLVAAGQSASAAFSPLASGSYLLVVESPDLTAAGSFSLELEKFSPPGNMICAAATPLPWSGPSASVSASTQGYLNDLGSLVRCSSSARRCSARRPTTRSISPRRATSFCSSRASPR